MSDKDDPFGLRPAWVQDIIDEEDARVVAMGETYGMAGNQDEPDAVRIARLEASLAALKGENERLRNAVADMRATPDDFLRLEVLRLRLALERIASGGCESGMHTLCMTLAEAALASPSPEEPKDG